MAGSIKVIHEVTDIASGQIVILAGSGTHKSAQFYVDLTAITPAGGTMDVTVQLLTGSRTTDIAAATSLGATGVTRLTPTAGVFNTAGRAIPEPNKITWTRNGVPTGVSGKVYAMYGD